MAAAASVGEQERIRRRAFCRETGSSSRYKIISALPVPGVGQRQSRFDIGDGILCLMGISNIMRLALALVWPVFQFLISSVKHPSNIPELLSPEFVPGDVVAVSEICVVFRATHAPIVECDSVFDRAVISSACSVE